MANFDWRVEGGTIFVRDNRAGKKASSALKADEVIQNCLTYATELDRIV